MQKIFIEAEKHRGTSLVEILQNCVIFNDKTFESITGKKINKKDVQLIVEHGKPMIFGAESNKGITFNGSKIEVVQIGENGITEKDILVHDAKTEDSVLHSILGKMMPPEFPAVLGVIRSVEKPTFNDGMLEQLKYEKKNAKFKNVNELINSGETWKI